MRSRPSLRHTTRSERSASSAIVAVPRPQSGRGTRHAPRSAAGPARPAANARAATIRSHRPRRRVSRRRTTLLADRNPRSPGHALGSFDHREPVGPLSRCATHSSDSSQDMCGWSQHSHDTRVASGDDLGRRRSHAPGEGGLRPGAPIETATSSWVTCSSRWRSRTASTHSPSPVTDRSPWRHSSPSGASHPSGRTARWPCRPGGRAGRRGGPRPGMSHRRGGPARRRHAILVDPRAHARTGR